MDYHHGSGSWNLAPIALRLLQLVGSSFPKLSQKKRYVDVFHLHLHLILYQNHPSPYIGKKSLAPERLPCTPLCANAETSARYIRSSNVLRSIFSLDAYHNSCETLAYLSGSFSRKMSSTSALSNGLLTQSTVYHGMWINWSQGFVRGATLTTTTTGGAILVALLALFIQFMGSHMWEILRFTVHQIRVGKRPRDGLYHQQQVSFGILLQHMQLEP